LVHSRTEGLQNTGSHNISPKSSARKNAYSKSKSVIFGMSVNELVKTEKKVPPRVATKTKPDLQIEDKNNTNDYKTQEDLNKASVVEVLNSNSDFDKKWLYLFAFLLVLVAGIASVSYVYRDKFDDWEIEEE